MSQSVASVTVAYNPGPGFRAHLEKLSSQSHSLDEIIVANNASTTFPVEMLARDFPHVHVLDLQTNEGVGAYATGMEYAVRRGHSWVWTMDDDSQPSATTLAQLLAVYDSDSTPGNIGLIAPLPVSASTGDPYPLWMWHGGLSERPFDEKTADIIEVDLVISSGSLVHRNAIDAVGLPRKDFFMDWLDYEYCLRMRAKGFRVVVVKNCRMPHYLGQPQLLSFCGVKVERSVHAAWREYYKIRNIAYVVWNERPELRAKLFVLRIFAKSAIAAILLDREKLHRLHLMWAGLNDGIRGRLGARVRPAV